MNPQTVQRSQHDDLLGEIQEAQAVLRAAWQTYPDMPEMTGVLGLLRTKLENIEQAAQVVDRRACRHTPAEREA